jgi:nucleoside-diphosphate-sugar epimerase
MTVLVTGARGWIGTFVCQWLSAVGCTVRKTVRQSPAIDEFAWGCTRLGHDSQLNQALEGCHAVVHYGSHVHRSVENSADASLFQQVNVEGTRQLVAGRLAAGVDRIVYASTVAIYVGPTPNRRTRMPR